MAQTGRHVACDHFVYLVDKEDFENPPAWLRDNFTIIDGGTHAGGSSRNKLIIFKDGTYLELFNWILEPKEFLAWSDKPPGLIDFALTSLQPSTAQSNYISMSQALESGTGSDMGVSFDHPRAGGRKRKDGLDVKWETTRSILVTAASTPDSALFPTQRLDVPFFCHDITARSVRVPFEDEIITNHPCGAVGISNLEVLVPTSHFQHYINLYGAIVGAAGQSRSSDSQTNKATFQVPAPHRQGCDPTLTIVAVQESRKNKPVDADQVWLSRRGIGIRSLFLTVPRGSVHGQGTLELDTKPALPSSIFLKSEKTQM